MKNLFRAEASDDDEEKVEEPEESRDDQRKMPRVESTLRNVFNLGKGKFFIKIYEKVFLLSVI